MKKIFLGLLTLLILASGCETVREGVSWVPYTPENMTQALTSGTPTIACFSAGWCPHCRHMYNNTFADARVMEAMQPFNRVKVDMTYSSIENQAASSRFAVSGFPTTLFFDSKGKEVFALRVVGEQSPEQFLQTLERFKKSA
jgi:thiol:disulfide interchange protein DsbD